jgi:uncharacterized membrane protein YdjX (TVP38/TMEM64 family)
VPAPTRPGAPGTEPDDDLGLEAPPPRAGIVFTLIGIAILAALIAAIEPLRDGISEAVSGDTAALRREIRGLGFSGGLIVLALAVAHAVVWYPTEILNAAVGFVYGFWGGLALVMVGWAINAVIGYWIGKHAARPLLWRLIGHQRFDALEAIAERGGTTMLLAMRLIPIVPFSLFSIVAGAARVPLGRFMWTSVVGYIPLTALFVYLGTQLEELSPTDPVLWLGAIAIIAVLVVAHRLRHFLRAPDEAS